MHDLLGSLEYGDADQWMAATRGQARLRMFGFGYVRYVVFSFQGRASSDTVLTDRLIIRPAPSRTTPAPPVGSPGLRGTTARSRDRKCPPRW